MRGNFLKTEISAYLSYQTVRELFKIHLVQENL